ncbi:hypothetical protein OQA88_8282 [Cercophora sp. LCS_1]
MTQKLYTESTLALHSVLRASLLTRRVLSSSLSRRRNSQITKSDTSPVTVADFAVQALLISAIHAAYPLDAFVGEEDASELRSDPELLRQVWELIQSVSETDTSGLALPQSEEEVCELIDLGGGGRGGREGRFWALDPIDGTAAFIRGEQFAISLALVEDGEEVVGVLGCPNLGLEDAVCGRVREEDVDAVGCGVVLSAVRGQGAWVRGVGADGEVQGANQVVRTGKKGVKLEDLHFLDSSLSPATLSERVEELAGFAGAQYPGTEMYSSHMRYAASILGGKECVQVRFPASRRPPWCLWDHAGSQLIYTESGGKITDLRGRKFDFGRGRDLAGNYGMIAADESVHGEILELVTAMLERDGEVPTPIEA